MLAKYTLAKANTGGYITPALKLGLIEEGVNGFSQSVFLNKILNSFLENCRSVRY